MVSAASAVLAAVVALGLVGGVIIKVGKFTCCMFCSVATEVVVSDVTDESICVKGCAI